MEKMICRTCGAVGTPENLDPRGGGFGTLFLVIGSLLFLGVVLTFFLGCGVGCFGLPFSLGSIGLGWWMTHRTPPLRCTACGARGSLLPLLTPAGRALAKQYHPNMVFPD